MSSHNPSTLPPHTAHLRTAELLVAVDGGGSKTRAVIADHSGTILGTGLAGSSNYQAIGFAAATAALQIALRSALQAANLAADEPLAAACFGLAGVDRPADQTLFLDWLSSQGIAQRAMVVNDVELVLAGGTPDGWGIALIAGTGAIGYGRSPEGRTVRVSGWGYLLGDEGSGYDLALRTLRLATQTADGRANAPTVLQAVLDHWSLQTPEQLIEQVYSPHMTRAELATLARRILALAANGDPAARELLAQSAQELQRVLQAVASQLKIDQPPVALGGGLLCASPELQHALTESMPLGPVRTVPDPAQGALILARRLMENQG